MRLQTLALLAASVASTAAFPASSMASRGRRDSGTHRLCLDTSLHNCVEVESPIEGVCYNVPANLNRNVFSVQSDWVCNYFVGPNCKGDSSDWQNGNVTSFAAIDDENGQSFSNKVGSYVCVTRADGSWRPSGL